MKTPEELAREMLTRINEDLAITNPGHPIDIYAPFANAMFREFARQLLRLDWNGRL